MHVSIEQCIQLICSIYGMALNVAQSKASENIQNIQYKRVRTHLYMHAQRTIYISRSQKQMYVQLSTSQHKLNETAFPPLLCPSPQMLATIIIILEQQQQKLTLSVKSSNDSNNRNSMQVTGRNVLMLVSLTLCVFSRPLCCLFVLL